MRQRTTWADVILFSPDAIVHVKPSLCLCSMIDLSPLGGTETANKCVTFFERGFAILKQVCPQTQACFCQSGMDVLCRVGGSAHVAPDVHGTLQATEIAVLCQKGHVARNCL